jgi:alpha-tubulin suppressor-like RCC1 family protein
LEAGEANSAVITSKNELYIWGIGLNGRLGTGKTQNSLLPTLIEDLRNVKVEDVSLGSNHSLCLLRNGKVLCWGSSKDGKMGLEAGMDRNFLTPKELVALDKEKIF